MALSLLFSVSRQLLPILADLEQGKKASTNFFHDESNLIHRIQIPTSTEELFSSGVGGVWVLPQARTEKAKGRSILISHTVPKSCLSESTND